MKGLSLATAFAITLGFVVLGCEDLTNPVESSPTGDVSLDVAQAETFTENVKIPISLVVFVDCADGGAGELVELSGDLHVLLHTTVNGNRFRVKEHFQPQGISGVGLSTGDKYQGTGVTQTQFGGSFVNGQFEQTFVNNFRIIGQGPGNNFLVHETFHITFNAKGDVTASVDNFKIDCK